MDLVASKPFVFMITCGFIVFVLMGAHIWSISPISDGVITAPEMTWWELTALSFGALSMLAGIMMASSHAFAQGRIWWGWTTTLLWPVSFVYMWRVAAGGFNEKADANEN